MSWSLRVKKRSDISPALSSGMVLGSLILGLGCGGMMFLLKGVNPFFALQKIFLGSFGSWFSFKETVTKAIPLILVSSGLAVAFRAKCWNIGAEGQILFGAIFATWVGLHVPIDHPWLGISAMYLAGAVGGMTWALIPAFLKVRYQINEAISSLLLNYIAAEFVQYLIYGPWKGKSHYGFPLSEDFPSELALPMLYGSRIHLPTLVMAILAALILAFLLRRTILGFEAVVIGENPEAANYAGIPYGRTVALVMAISGAMAGLAGVGEVAGIHRHLTYPGAISSGYGFTAIITAFLAGLDPMWVMVSSIFFGGILVGGDVIQTSLGLPFATVHIFNGLILFSLLLGNFFQKHRLTFVSDRLKESPIG